MAKAKKPAPEALSAVRGAAPMSLDQAQAIGQANLNSGFPIPKRAKAALDEAGVQLTRQEPPAPAPETPTETVQSKED